MPSSPKNGWKNPALYKTRICDNWSQGKLCKYGSSCWFAHNLSELRVVPHLDDNPTAKTLSLAEVVDMLPPSSNRSRALNEVTCMMNNANVDLFNRFTVPLLNAMVLRMAIGQKNQQDPSFENLLPLLMQTFNSPPPSTSPCAGFNSPGSNRSGATDISCPHNFKTFKDPVNSSFLSNTSLQSTPSHVSFRSNTFNNNNGSVNNSLSPGFLNNGYHPAWKNETADFDESIDKAVFEPIHQRFDKYCDNFFV